MLRSVKHSLTRFLWQVALKKLKRLYTDLPISMHQGSPAIKLNHKAQLHFQTLHILQTISVELKKLKKGGKRSLTSRPFQTSIDRKEIIILPKPRAMNLILFRNFKKSRKINFDVGLCSSLVSIIFINSKIK